MFLPPFSIIDRAVIALDKIGDSLADHVDRSDWIAGYHLSDIRERR